MRIQNRLFACLAVVVMMISNAALAEEKPFLVIETASHNVKVSEDGTGIVKDIHCAGCDFNIVEITPRTKATRQGQEVSILEVRGLRETIVMVSFDPDTRKVQFVRW